MKRLIINFIFLFFSFVFSAASFSQDLSITSDVTWEPGSYTYNNVLITNGATLTFNGAVTLNAKNLTLDSTSTISAETKGYPRVQGPGAGISESGIGAGYGGKGGSDSTGKPGGSSYGSSLAPIDLGSGGGDYGHSGGAGGGAVRLNISGSLTLNGKITANGGSGNNDAYTGGGSGGSIYIIARSLAGSGLLTANGGGSGYAGGGGGGGRIAVYYQTSAFAGTAQAKGGVSLKLGLNKDGEDGTVVFIDTLNKILYPGHSFRFQENDSPFSFSKIALNNSKVTSEGNINIATNDLFIDNGSYFTLGGTATALTANNLKADNNSNLTLNDSCVLTISSLFSLNATSSLAFTGSQTLSASSITLDGSSVLTLSGQEILALNELNLSHNSILTHLPRGKISLALANLTLDSTSTISAETKGYPRVQGPGAGISESGIGAGYGGKGGSDSTGKPGGSSYGSSLAPIDLGSGGGDYGHSGGAGGGAVRLNISGSLTLNGKITANGGSGNNDAYTGGGSGGSIYIIARSLAGSGLLTANGGGSGYAGGGGGGGRIAVYYQTSAFAGTAQAKGGVSLKLGLNKDGEDGTVVLQGSSLDVAITAFTLLEKSSTVVSTSRETLSTHTASASNITVAGTLKGTLNFTALEFITITSGSFAGKGFSKGEFTTTLDGVSYAGTLKVVSYFLSAENKIYLKGQIEGELNGICEGYLIESTPGSQIYDKFQAACKINKLKTETLSATLNLEGGLTYQPAYDFTSEIYLYQTDYEGSAFGYYAGPLSAVVTRMRLAGENTYKGEGFSIISYNTALGQSQAYSYNKQTSAGTTEFQGFFESPLLGKLLATLNENQTPKTFSGIIERLDLGLTPVPDLKVKVWGPERVSPGQTINYIIEYRNDGVKAAGETLLFVALDNSLKYISASPGAFYNDILNTVDWNLGNLPAKSSGYLTIQAEVAWGLAQGTALGTNAIINELLSHSQKKGIFVNGIGLQVGELLDMDYVKICKNFASSKDLEWIPAYDTGSGLGDVREVINAFKGVATEHNELLNNKVTGGFEYGSAWGYSGGTRTLVTAIIQGKLKTNELVLISPVMIAPF